MTFRRSALTVLLAVVIGAPITVSPDLRTVSAYEPPAAALGATSAQQAVAEDVFDDTRLHDVRLFIHSKDLAQLRARYRENINTPADIQIDGTRVRNVAVRSRGGGSRNPTKMGLRVDFNFYTPNQEFRGLEAIILDNLWQDNALIREALTMKLFRRMGEPAPREAFCRLFLNNQYQGLYALVEEIDGDFAARETGEAGGYVFEYHWNYNYYGDDLGPDLDPYKPLFEPRTHETESDEQLYGPIRDLFHNMNEPDDAVWLDVIGQRLDLPQFMRMLGIEAFVGEGDGLLGYAGMNNFYLFRSPGTARHRVLPWDRDLSFQFEFALPERGLDENVVFRRAYSNLELRNVYLDAILAAVQIATDENWLEVEIDRLAALIDAAARQDTLKQYSNEDFDLGVEFVRQIARVRPPFLVDEIARLR
jgi:spore coat protein CotH